MDTDEQHQHDDQHPNPSDKLVLTRTREALSPYLPPPVLNAIHTIDSNPQLQQLVGNEPSMSIATAILCIYVIGFVFKTISSFNMTITGKKKQSVEGLVDDEPESAVTSHLSKLTTRGNGQYGDLIVLFGPSQSGKTVLFHTLVSTSSSSSTSPSKIDPSVHVPQTVMSLKAKFTTLTIPPNDDDDNNNINDKTLTIRIVDYPGHTSLSSQLPSLLHPSSKYTKNSSFSRALFVVDSTKPLTDAANMLYHQVLTNSTLLDAWEKTMNKTGQVLQIMVVCTKIDMKNSKNWRRIKIQMRNELEKIRKIAISTNATTASLQGGHGSIENVDDEPQAAMRDLTGKNIDLDDLGNNGVPMIKLHFISLGCRGEMEGMKEVQAFVNYGKVLNDSTSALKSARKMV